MNKLMLLAVLVCFIVVPGSKAFAGAWAMPKGKLYSRLSYNKYEAKKFFDEDGDTRSSSPGDGRGRHFEYIEDRYTLYLEYGLLENITLLASIDSKNAEWTYKRGGIPPVPVEKSAQTNGIGDIQLGVKYQFFSSDIGVLSLQGLLKTAEAYDHRHTGDLEIQLGDAQDDYEVRLMYGRSLYPLIPGYCNLETGYRWRTQDPADEFKYLAEIGVDVTKMIYLRAKLDGSLDMGNGDDVATLAYDANGNEVELGKLELTAGIKLSQQWGCELSCTNDLYGKNTTKGTTYSFALTFIGF
ncbi:MAG: hypothetical protein JXO49_04565 [Deltaproteobacteria bacterium]|nr:hypothetical protein [Candidatus Anaeroferrophillus wilburensis]MBN2888601.1 hypothetical protein [Deltaproteobacteria bacterium]